MVVRLDAREIEDMVDKASENNPELEKSLEMFRKMDKDVFRGFVFDADPAHIQGTNLTNINISMPQEPFFRSMPPAFLSGAMAELLKNEPGVKIISDGFDTTQNGIDIGFIETNYTLKDIQGKAFTAYQKMVILQVSDGSVILTFTTPIDLKNKTLPFFDAIVESFELLD